MKIKAKVTIATVSSILATASVMIGVLIERQGVLAEQIREEIDFMARSEAESIAMGVYNMVQASGPASAAEGRCRPERGA